MPHGVDSVNGSDRLMGCNDILVSGAFTLCGSLVNELQSFLTDGNIPIINRSNTNWASELVTVRKRNLTDKITQDHVLLTFIFAEREEIAGIYLDLLLCPEWNIGAPLITVFGSNNIYFSYVYTDHNADYIKQYKPHQTKCECKMSTIVIPIQGGEPAYPIWHILVTFDEIRDIQWVHLGEVRFSHVPIIETIPDADVFCTPQDIPG